MKIIPGIKAEDFNEAVALAIGDAGVIGMSPKAVSLFLPVTDDGKLRSDTEKAVASTIRNRYRGKPSWHGPHWHVPIPQLRYDARETPHLVIEVRMHLVAALHVETTSSGFAVTLVGILGQPEFLVIPMVFLQAILANDLGRFGVLVRSTTHTTWDVPGAKPVQLPNGFVDQLTDVLGRKPVVDWLYDFGAQGQNVAPLVAGSLLGLQLGNNVPAVPLESESVTTERLVGILEGMAYTVKEAKEMVNRAAPYLRTEHNLEEAVRIVLQQAGKGV